MGDLGLCIDQSRPSLPPSGCPAAASSRECTNPFSSFLGCMSQLTANGQPVDLMKVQQRLMGDFGHLQVDTCGIIDRSDGNPERSRKRVSKMEGWIIPFIFTLSVCVTVSCT